jgi:hypothetical protein
VASSPLPPPGAFTALAGCTPLGSDYSHVAMPRSLKSKREQQRAATRESGGAVLVLSAASRRRAGMGALPDDWWEHWGVAGDSVTQARCPQWWRAFAVRGDTATYEVYADDVRRGTSHCSCPAWRFRGRTTCKHIERVQRHGCFGAGPNDLRAFGVEITSESLMRSTQHTGLRCACGQMMLAPLMRMRDDAGHQIVEVVWLGFTSSYTYAWVGRVRAAGDVVTVTAAPATVVALGSDWAGELKVIGGRRA